MTNEELARYYRRVAETLSDSWSHQSEHEDIQIISMLRERAQALEPSLPQGGTVVWWRYSPRYASTPYGPWELGITANAGDGIYAADGSIYPWDKIEYHEARVSGEPSNA